MTLHLFEAFGIEIEWMIVDRRTCAVAPVSDQVLTALNDGALTGDVERNGVGWSNELVLHVLELKSHPPCSNLGSWMGSVMTAVGEVNKVLDQRGLRLMPTAMHPTFDPARETRLWPHDSGEIYAAYDRIFSCQGHGWSNLQSVHINFPFCGDDEFARLHAAIRAVLPIIPGLAASSPFVEGQATGWLDNRLRYYSENQKRIPQITGLVIPEVARSRQEYQRVILEPAYRAVQPFDPDGLLQEEWLNSRGAIARFDRDAIEIRIVDAQESPRADLAVAAAVIGAVEALAGQGDLDRLHALSTEGLARIFLAGVREGGAVRVVDRHYLDVWGYRGPECTTQELWRHIASRIMNWRGMDGTADRLIERGTLASVLIDRVRKGQAIDALCHELCDLLAGNSLLQSRESVK